MKYLGRCLIKVSFLLALSSKIFALGLPESGFKLVNDIIHRIYAPKVSRKLASTLKLREYYNGFGGAFKVDSAFRLPYNKEFVVTLTGKIPKFEGMSKEGYALVVCHEIGHILGGAPYHKSNLSKWSSVEGQADYYAANQCMWQYMKYDAKSDVISHLNKDTLRLCNEAYGHDMSKNSSCLQVMSGIISLQDYFNATSSKNQPVDFRNKDPNRVDKTLIKFAPWDQCRIDTFMAGLFNKPRPRCWYKE